MKKSVTIVIGGVIAALVLLGYCVYDLAIQNGQDTVIRITQTDANGTPISASSPVVVVNKAGHHNPFHDTVAGYSLLSKNPLGNRIPRKNMTVSLQYKSATDQKTAINTLSRAKYINVATQQITTPVLNNQQFEGRRNRKKVLRVSTSMDGLTWSKLTLDYPNVDMQHPVAFFQDNMLYVLSNDSMYTTTNYSKWQKKDLRLKSSMFDDAKAFGTFNQGDIDYLIVKARANDTKKVQFYFGEMNFKNGKPTNWRTIVIPNSSKKIVKSIQRLGNSYYAVCTNKSKVELYRTQDLASRFKLVSRVKANTQDQISSANLVSLPNNQFRLLYNELDNDKFQTGTFFQNLSARLKPIDKQGILTTDFFWCDFQTVRSGF